VRLCISFYYEGRVFFSRVVCSSTGEVFWQSSHGLLNKDERKKNKKKRNNDI